MSYVQGSVVRVRGRFTNEKTGTPEEPPEVICRIERPDNDDPDAVVVEEYRLSESTVVNDPDVAGGYYHDMDTSPAYGTWHYQFQNEGATKVVERKKVTVRKAIPAPTP